MDATSELKTLSSRVHVAGENIRKSDEYSYEVARSMRLTERFEQSYQFDYEFDMQLECTITANVDTRKRVVTSIEVVESQYTLNGSIMGTYAK